MTITTASSNQSSTLTTTTTTTTAAASATAKTSHEDDDDACHPSRKCWRTSRERSRLKARHDIRQRILLLGQEQEQTQRPPLLAPEPEPALAELLVTEHQDDNSNEVYSFLRRIITGDRSFFSLHSLQQHARLLSSPLVADDAMMRHISSLLLLKNQHPMLLERMQTETEDAENELESFTFMEFAVWMHRYSIVAALLTGGINPCVRGRNNHSRDAKEEEVEEELVILGELQTLGRQQVLQRFVAQGTFPLSLSTYIVKRVVEMRQPWRRPKSSSTSTSSSYCSLCQRTRDIAPILCCFGEPCHHEYCEICLWKNLLEHLDERLGTVVLCPVCGAGDDMRDGHDDDNSSNISIQQSLKKYLALPVDQEQLQKQPKPPRRQLQFELAETWSQALLPTVGRTQTVRRERLAKYALQGNYHGVRACLQQGVDILAALNEYGQSALYLAAWRGHVNIVQLLLSFQNDNDDDNNYSNGLLLATATANGGTALEAAMANGHVEVVHLLQQAAANANLLHDNTKSAVLFDKKKLLVPSDHHCRLPQTLLLVNSDVSNTRTTTANNAGVSAEEEEEPAGGMGGGCSFLIDHAISPSAAVELVKLYKSLPIAAQESSSSSSLDLKKKKKKDGACCSSVRSYYCDAEKVISSLLAHVLKNNLPAREGGGATVVPDDVMDETIVVFPHMRFLCYSQPGAALPPHVDLTRVHPFSGKRSTHSFLLYLTDCNQGGETTLLRSSTTSSNSNGGAPGLAGKQQCPEVSTSLRQDDKGILARVKPKCCRLLVFPHNCLHEGERVVDVPKLLIRGEVRLPGYSATSQ